MISRFKGGLKWKNEDKVTLQSFFKLTNIIVVVECAEALLEKRKSRVWYFDSLNSTIKTTRGRPPIVSSITLSGVSHFTQVLTNKNPYTCNIVPKCNKCGENRHKLNIYLKQRVVNFCRLNWRGSKT